MWEKSHNDVFAMKVLSKENVMTRNQVEHTKIESNVPEARSNSLCRSIMRFRPRASCTLRVVSVRTIASPTHPKYSWRSNTVST